MGLAHPDRGEHLIPEHHGHSRPSGFGRSRPRERSGEVTRAVGAGIIKGTLGSGEYDGWINGLAQERERKSCFLHRVGSVRDDDGMRPSAVTSQLVDISSGEGGGDERARIAHLDRKSTRLNSSHVSISYAVFCLKTKMRKLKRMLIVHA